jgi:RNA polymerase sigma-70 factor (TIGR02960 family)
MRANVETRARAGDEQAFQALTEPYRRELQVHCYRIVGSPQDAEDLVQETLLAAWRGLDGFAGRSSVRTWLYRIATNRCLNALRDRSRRPGGAPDLPPEPPEPTRVGEPLWLQPYPDALLDAIPDAAPGPEQRYEAREAVGLAFVAGLQRLPPSQRAILVLRDVLGYRANEVAAMLDTTAASVNSGLQRARAALEGRVPAAAGRERAPLPRSAAERRLVGRFADAFEAGDVDTVVELLTDDAWLTMPPVPLEYQGRERIGRFLSTVPADGDLSRFRLVATRANGQPAFGLYTRDPQCAIAHATGILVLTLEGDRIAAITAFHDTAVLPFFGLPRTLALD